MSKKCLSALLELLYPPSLVWYLLCTTPFCFAAAGFTSWMYGNFSMRLGNLVSTSYFHIFELYLKHINSFICQSVRLRPFLLDSKKFSIRETLNLSTCANSSTDTNQISQVSHVRCYLSPVFCHMPHVMCQVLSVTNSHSPGPSPCKIPQHA